MLLTLMLAACTENSLFNIDDANGAIDGDSATPGDTATSDDPDGQGLGNGDASVSGRICDPSGGSWVAGALVYVDVDENADGTIDYRRETTTDVEGRFTLTGLPTGTWLVHVERGSFVHEFEVTLNGGMYEMSDPECLPADGVDIAVITGAYDSIETVLDRMGFEYTLYDGESWWGEGEHVKFLRNRTEMAKYDIIFLNCGMSDSWLVYEGEIAGNLNWYVKNGGSVYASDWAYYAFEAAFPTAVTFHGNDSTPGAAYVGRATTINASVVDAHLKLVLGKDSAKINYDLPSWAVPESAKGDVTVLLQGDAPLDMGGTVKSSPLAVEIDPGGRFVYTSFHTERQTTGDMDKMLQEIILSL